ncbi:dGTP triphosphohydrolase, partial [uncultured Imperialibacter sp.]|uniref:dGTP triphosphohydrolase n=1 Tax=uncultured Imperialibacter sp. TaxID=1672639 RepID=UPI0030DC1A61|tara:strand:+ start:102797 stop:104026 length:1230 start_codon:yes stop_codon:yes gene_type:complete
MHDKTQVFPLTTDDNIHSRLTHSMEVMAIGHSLGLRVVENESFLEKTGQNKEFAHRTIPVILKNACLVHDIGNPPFGHFGETVISHYFTKLFNSQLADGLNFQLSDVEKEDFKYFDGNAQGFRVLTKLQVLNDPNGLNLTYATLGAYLKYPNVGALDKTSLSTKKRGVFQSEKDILSSVLQNCNLIVNGNPTRHPLSFLMEAADSICYLVMDIEDGFNKGWYRFNEIAESLKEIASCEAKIIELNNISGIGSEITKMVEFRIFLIARLVRLAIDNFVNNLEAITEGSYNHELIEDDSSGLSDLLRNFVDQKIFPKRDIQQLELTGHSILTGLLDYYIEFIFHESKHYRKRAKNMVSGSIIRASLIENGIDDFDGLSDYYKLRVIVDFITGMTDQFALQQYQKLSGQKII